MFKSITLGASALALVMLPVAASAASPVRAQTAAADQNELAGGSAQVLPLVILAGVIAGVAYLVVDHEDNNDDRPSSR